MKTVDTNAYISALRDLTEQNKEVSLLISGNSMVPFLVHGRDYIVFEKPGRELRLGDMVFYQRDAGQFVMHRIFDKKPEGYYLVGDAQMHIEGPVGREQIFALVTKAKRKGKWIGPGNFWWEFFEHVWIRVIPFRRMITKAYMILRRIG